MDKVEWTYNEDDEWEAVIGPLLVRVYPFYKRYKAVYELEEESTREFETLEEAQQFVIEQARQIGRLLS